MYFEKWQALGNDYLIFEADKLKFQLTSGIVKRICKFHFGVGADGVLLLHKPQERGFVARVQIFNPDGSQAELSGNGIRQAILYLRQRGWTNADTFSLETAAGEIRPTITSPTTCTVDMGRAKLTSSDFPSGGADGKGVLESGGRSWNFQHISIGNPQCVMFLSGSDAEQLEKLDLQALGPAIENSPLFPNRTNVSFVREESPGVLRARIFERGVGETLSSGTGASGAAVAYMLNGGESPVTVKLDGGDLQVDVGEDMQVKLTGWAKPIFKGELAPEFIQELGVTDATK